MNRKQLESAASDNSHLRGLFGVPIGLLAILSALGNWQLGPLRHSWAFMVGAAILAAAGLSIRRYYNENYGRVRLSTRQHVRATVAIAITIPVVVGASFLARSRAGWSLDLPVNTTAALFALVMLVSVAVTAGLRAHHVVIFGALLVVGLAPVWDGGDPSNVGLVLAGVAIMAAGILDHRLLVRTFGPPRSLDLENSGVGA
jgi:hypothetical protein